MILSMVQCLFNVLGACIMFNQPHECRVNDNYHGHISNMFPHHNISLQHQIIHCIYPPLSHGPNGLRQALLWTTHVQNTRLSSPNHVTTNKVADNKATTDTHHQRALNSSSRVRRCAQNKSSRFNWVQEMAPLLLVENKQKDRQTPFTSSNHFSPWAGKLLVRLNPMMILLF